MERFGYSPISRMDPSSLPREVHIWLLPAPERAAGPAAAGLERLLDVSERARAARFARAADAARSVASRALLRRTLSRYASVTPEQWRFATTPHGRPVLAARGPDGDLRFSVAHTAGLAAVAVAHGREVGVDVERLDRLVRRDLAARVCSPREAAALRARTPGDWPRAFLEYWTLKEAYLKARGTGLALPPRAVTLHLAPGAPPRVSFAPPIVDDPDRWQFASTTPTPDHRLALAVERRGPDLPVRLAVVTLEELLS